MTGLLVVLILIFGLAAAGVGPALAINRDEALLTLAGLAFLYGAGLVYVVLLAFTVAGIPWSFLSTAATIAAISLLTFLRRRGAGSRDRVRPSLIDLGTVTVAAVYAASALMARPSHFDFFGIWGMKGRVFFEMRGIDWRFLESEWNSYWHPDYPLLLPFNYTFSALASGGWNDRWLGAYSVAFGIALLMIIRGVAATELSAHAAALVAFGGAAFGLAPQIGIAEAPFIAYGTAGLLMIRRAIVSGDDAPMRHGGFLLGFAAVTKNEGITLCLAAAVAMLIVRAPFRRLIALWPCALLLGSWLALRALHALPTDVMADGFFQRVTSRMTALPQFGMALLQSLSRPWLWAALVAGLVIARRHLARGDGFLLTAAAIQLMFVIAVYLGTPYDAAWHVASSWGRISRQVGGPVLLATMLALAHLARRDHDLTHAKA